MPGLFKVGCTTRAVEQRVEELNAATGVPAPFVIEAVFPSGRPLEDETRVHERLKDTRLVGREFFETDLRKVVSAIQSIVGMKAMFIRFQEPRSENPLTLAAEPQPLNRWTCGLCKHVWDAPPTPVLEKCPKCLSFSIVKLGLARDTLAFGA